MTIRNISIFTTEFINGEDDARFRKTLINHSSGSPLYVRSLLKDSSEYAFALRDALSDSHLADVITEAGVSAKKKTINLYQPDSEVGLEYTGTLSFEWTTYFEGHTLQWSKGLLGSIYCSLIRKPDPSVEICKYVPGNKKSPPSFTILDYNLARFDLEDIRGLEIVLLCSVFTFLDMQNQEVGPGEPAKDEPMMTSAVPISAAPAGPALPERKPSLYEHPRSKLQTIDANTLNISPDLDFEGQVRKTLNMLDGNVFVTLHAPESAAVQTTIRVAESAKRRYMKRPGGMRDDEDLHLYVITDDLLKDRRVSKVHVPPSTLTIHISKWHMPELEEKQQQKRKMMEDSADDIESDSIDNTTRVSRMAPSPTTPTNPRMSFINSLNKLRRGVGKV